MSVLNELDKDEADSLPGNSNQHKNQRSNDSNQFPYKTSQSFNTIESKSSDKSQLNDPRTHAPYRDDSFTSHKTPISPLDFNLTTQRDRSLSRSSANNYNLSAFQSNLPKDKMMKKERAKYQNEDKKQYTQFTRPAHTIILQGLDMTNESLQSILLELIVTKELRLTNVKYTVPRHAFLIIAVVPENYHRLSISPQLMDRFFISYNFDEDAFTRPNTSFTTTPRSLNLRRHAYMRNDEIKYLSEKTKSIYVNIDVTRYVRDIVVGIRTHPRVKGGLTARCSKDLITVTK
ncbi:hypothetical protein BDB01DRAFT_808087 [Pilobolus umbonatus]|nr:hypothetical protein BDB01DRAFT_808087 [Pilobolus umbonatus]